LGRSDMFRYTQLLGYPDGMDEFRELYLELCKFWELDENSGFDLALFTQLANDPESDFYVDDEMLEDVRSKVLSARDRRVKDMFQALDVNKTDRLNLPEMFRFAALIGFPGDMDEFQEEYSSLCEARGQNKQVGFAIEAFSELLNDAESEYCCDDDMLADFCSQLGEAASAAVTAPVAASQDSRDDLIRTLFEALDVNKNERLTHPEMYRLAQLVGYPGDAEEFKEEYADLCRNCRQDGNAGFDIRGFTSLLNDAESDYFCDDDMLTDFCAQAVDTASPAPAEPTSTAADPRIERITDLFQALDRGNNKALNFIELLRFAKLVGFPGSDEDFREEYASLCQSSGRDQKKGFDVEAFKTLVNDVESDYWCDDDMLTDYLKKLADGPSSGQDDVGAGSREDQIKALFDALDKNKDGQLSSAEMFPFAQAIGFPSDGDFDDEFKELCQDRGVDSVRGFSFNMFQEILDDQDGDYYLDDEGLADISKTLGSAPESSPWDDAVAELFQALDSVGDQRLGAEEFFVFAAAVGYPGTKEEFCGEEYYGMCTDYRVADPNRGIDLKEFMQIIGDKESDYNVESEAELQEIMEKAREKNSKF